MHRLYFVLFALLMLVTPPSRMVAQRTCCSKQPSHCKHCSPDPKRLFSSHTTVAATVGGIVLQDEYLSSLRYGGMVYGVELTEELPLFPQWMLFLEGSFQRANTYNPARTALNAFMRGHTSVAGLYRWVLPHHFSIATGPSLMISGRYISNSRNTNNIISVGAGLDAGVAFMLGYRVPSPKWPLSIRMKGALALLGLTHHIGYAESYYEQAFHQEGIARSLRITHPLNNRRSHLRLGVEVPLWHVCTLQVGYRWDWEHSTYGQRRRSLLLQQATLGFSWDFLRFTGRKGALSSLERETFFFRQ